MTDSIPESTRFRNSPLRVAIVDRIVPHYREGLYNALMADDEMSFTIIAAAKPIERIGTVAFPGPKIDGKPRWRWIDAPGHRIPLSRGKCAWQWGAAKAGLSRSFDAILMMANPNDPGMWLCAMFARLTRKRLVFWTHGLTKRDRPLHRVLRVWWMRFAHAFAIYGHFGKCGMLSEHFDPDRCHVCYNSLDYPSQKSLRESITPQDTAATRSDLFGDRADLPLAISVSRLSAFKRIDLLIHAHAKLQSQGIRSNLLIVGDGDERARLEALVESLHVRESVRFVGECYDERRLSNLIAASDVSITPGAIGLTVMHSLAYGVPCITHDDWYDHGPEFEAIIDGQTGAFFRKNDADDLARVMRAWLTSAPPLPHRSEISAKCIAHVERFFTPRIQAAVIKRALLGKKADDLWVAGGAIAD